MGGPERDSTSMSVTDASPQADDTRPFWQELLPAGPPPLDPPYTDAYPVRLPDGRWLVLPLRRPPSLGGRYATASLIVNQASFAVEEALIAARAERAFPFGADVVVGLPTLGLGLARGVAKALGHRRYVALGYSRKFWYREDLGVPVRSITSPGDEKKIYIDPRLVPQIAGMRVLVVDDAISGGATAAATIPFLKRLGAEPLGLVVAMRQSRRWVPAFERLGADWPERVAGVFDTPLFEAVDGGWAPLTEGT
jgi:adenine/guanine phosphoribosyltransferase-like PRPP-binding protein